MAGSSSNEEPRAPIKFECALSVADFLAAQRLHFRPKIFGRIVLYLFAFCLVVGLSQEVWMIIRGQVLPRGWWVLPAGVAYGALLFFIFLPWRVSRIFRANPHLSDPLIVSFTEEGLLLDSVRRQIKAPWSLLRKWKDNENVILVYHAPTQFHIFPQRGFRSAETFSEVKQMLRRHLGPPQA
ncbi:MAG TPA: YcxB family protein [Opitutaceae bacterium]|nr:YcxB family protein [Opitutaceae bacterium]